MKTIAPNQLAEQRRRVTPCTTEAKTWLTAELGLVHTLHCYNTVSEVNGDHEITGADKFPPRNCVVRLAAKPRMHLILKCEEDQPASSAFPSVKYWSIHLESALSYLGLLVLLFVTHSPSEKNLFRGSRGGQ